MKYNHYNIIILTYKYDKVKKKSGVFMGYAIFYCPMRFSDKLRSRDICPVIARTSHDLMTEIKYIISLCYDHDYDIDISEAAKKDHI